MSDMKDTNASGNTVISEEVIATIASSAALEVEGVASMAQKPADLKGLVSSAAERSVKVTTVNDENILDLYVNLKSSAKIPDVSLAVQKNVKSEVQAMTGKPVTKINVHVAGIVFDEEANEENNEPEAEKE